MTNKEIIEGLIDIKNWHCDGNPERYNLISCAIESLENQKTGHWIGIDVDTRKYCSCFQCSNCKGFVYPHLLLKELDYEYCPNCGANMRGE